MNVCTQLFIGQDEKPAYVVSGTHSVEDFVGIDRAVVVTRSNFNDMVKVMSDISKKYYGPLKWADLEARRG